MAAFFLFTSENIMKKDTFFVLSALAIISTACQSEAITTQYQCLNGCENGYSCYLGECISDDDGSCPEECKKNQICKDAVCIDVCRPECKEDQECVSGKCQDIKKVCRPECLSDEECIDGVCEKITCKPACQENEICENFKCRAVCSPACLEGEECQNGKCVEKKCIPECASTEKCTLGTCVSNVTQCIPECSETQVCQNGLCINKNQTCIPDCQSNEICKNGLCEKQVVSGCPPACPSGQECVNNQCITPDATCEPACDSNHTCVGGSCVEVGCSPACNPAQTCVNRVCTPQDACAADSDCTSAQYCRDNFCAPLVQCTDSSTCQNDTYCCAEPSCTHPNTCTPFGGSVTTMSSCSMQGSNALYDLDVQCVWNAPSNAVVVSSPIVVDTPFDSGKAQEIIIITYNRDNSTPSASDIEATTHGTGDVQGKIHILNGENCSEHQIISLYNIKDTKKVERIVGGTVAAAADVDNNGTIEIFVRGERIEATSTDLTAVKSFKDLVLRFSWDGSKYVNDFMYDSHKYGFGNVSLQQFKQDVPTVMLGKAIYKAATNAKYLGTGDGDYTVIPPIQTLGDLDLDAKLEVPGKTKIYRVKTSPEYSGTYDKYSTFSVGYTANTYSSSYHNLYADRPYADFGSLLSKNSFNFNTLDGKSEVVICSSEGIEIVSPSNDKDVSSTSVQVFSKTDIANVGPCAVGDFNGDGFPEIAAVASSGIYLISPKCTAAGGGCEARGVLWHKDISVTNSQYAATTGFDFDADGALELIESVNGFLRIRDGKTGTILASAWRPLEYNRQNWFETPIVVDVDNDNSAELIYTKTKSSKTFAIDDLDPGIQCSSAADCKSGLCTGKLCRCKTDDDCNFRAANDYKCAAPIDGSTASGNVCRAQATPGEDLNGLRVMRHRTNKWPGARNIWNQYNYNVINIHDNGTLPLPTEYHPDINNREKNSFRINTHIGSPHLTQETVSQADLTAKFSPQKLITGDTITGMICNRGLAEAPANVSVEFYYVDATSESALCTTTTQAPIAPASCSEVSCQDSIFASLPANITYRLKVNTDNAVNECNKRNNIAEILSTTPSGTTE